jgi:quercetin dioxygenase-like cupin family protein
MRTGRLLAASLAAVVIAAYAPHPARAAPPERSASKHGKQQTMVKPANDIQWSAGPASLPPGAQVALLEGDPAKEGMFTMRLKVPAGYRIPPHTHPKVERVTVLSGEMGLGMGPDFDESKLEKMPAGSFFVLQPGMQHFVAAGEDTVVQLNALGPWGIKYVRASDDPRNKPHASAPPAAGSGSSSKP